MSTRMTAPNNRRTDNLIVLGAIEPRFSPSQHGVFRRIASNGGARQTRRVAGTER